MKKIIFIVVSALFLMSNVLAQTEVLFGVWVLNEGVQDWNTGEMIVPASVGVYDVENAEYSEVMTFDDANFTTNILIENGSAYVGADNKIVKIGLDSGEIEAEVEVQGVRMLEYHDGVIYMTRGDSDPITWASVEFDSYLLWFDAETLEQIGQLPAEDGVGYACEGISIEEGRAYVAINNGFSWAQEVGIVGVYDISTGEYEEHDLGEDGKNPAHIKVVEGGVLTVNNTDWSATSLSRVDFEQLGSEENSVTTEFVDGVSAGCNAAAVIGDELIFQVSGEMGMRQALASDLSPVEEMWGPAEDNYYRMSVNPLNGEVYATVTNFSADELGEVHIINSDGQLLGSFEAGEVPGSIAFDIRSVESVFDLAQMENSKIIGEFDLLGRPWVEGNRGVKVTKMSDGSVVKVYEAR